MSQRHAISNTPMDVSQTINNTLFGAQQAGNLLHKEIELVYCLLTVMEMAPHHQDNNCLQVELSLINALQSHLTSHQPKSFRIWEKCATLCMSLEEKRFLKSKTDIDTMLAHAA